MTVSALPSYSFILTIVLFCSFTQTISIDDNETDEQIICEFKSVVASLSGNTPSGEKPYTVLELALPPSETEHTSSWLWPADYLLKRIKQWWQLMPTISFNLFIKGGFEVTWQGKRIATEGAIDAKYKPQDPNGEILEACAQGFNIIRDGQRSFWTILKYDLLKFTKKEPSDLPFTVSMQAHMRQRNSNIQIIYHLKPDEILTESLKKFYETANGTASKLYGKVAAVGATGVWLIAKMKGPKAPNEDKINSQEWDLKAEEQLQEENNTHISRRVAEPQQKQKENYSRTDKRVILKYPYYTRSVAQLRPQFEGLGRITRSQVKNHPELREIIDKSQNVLL
ncbi:hypothetical protein Ddc_00225 [Ditylenchus destructor]|nr:hypothetical protein Ddc_00225 [Ditylenchus destructor]